MLVPAELGGAQVMLNRHVRGTAQRTAQVILSAAQGRRLLRWLPLTRLDVGASREEHSIDALVRAHVADAYAVGVLLGPPRANAKPVLQCFDAAGRTIAFGKVGRPGLTAELVRHESRVLSWLGKRPLKQVAVPRVMYAGQWNGLELLLLSPMTSAQGGGTSWDVPLSAMIEIAEVDGVSDPLPAERTAYAAELAARVAAVHDDELARRWARVRDAVSGTALRLGRWHGDWAPWNMGRRGGVVEVWDWERSTGAVPMGFDVLHFAVQHAFGQHADTLECRRVLLAQEAVLGRWYPSDLERFAATRATALLYLVEVLQRYVGDSAAARTPALAGRIFTLGSVLDDLLDNATNASAAPAQKA
jgi:hypothetical protein